MFLRSLLLFALLIFLSIEGLVFECFGKCQCYPQFKIIQCATGYRNQLGLTSKADIDGFQVNEHSKNMKIVPEGTLKPLATAAPWKYGRSKREVDVERVKLWMRYFRRIGSKN
uniref:Uncharacterized protein n=1 Tax=Caenorhabditis tropicalis TaxID=1561998 RepID=A0A1I7UT31_9PELO